MASYTSVKEDSNALCYVWITFAFLIISIICFAIASPSNSLVYVGVVFLCLTAASAFTYLLRYVVKNKNSFLYDCCYCCCPCWHRCCRSILCLQPDDEDSIPSIAVSRRERLRIQTLHRAMHSPDGVATSHVATSHVTTVTADGNVTLSPADTTNIITVEARLTSLDKEIERQRRCYDNLQRQECVDDIIQSDYELLDLEQARLLSWIENQVVPSELELKAMKGRLKRIARNFRLARSRLHPQTTGMSVSVPDLFVPEVDMDAPEQVRIFAQDLPIPPAYSEQDPQPTSTKSYIQQNRLNELQAQNEGQRSHRGQSSDQGQTVVSQGQGPYVIPVPEYSVSGSSTSLNHQQTAAVSSSAETGAYQNAGYLGHVMSDPDLLAPPTYDAPPSYDEAITASPI